LPIISVESHGVSKVKDVLSESKLPYNVHTYDPDDASIVILNVKVEDRDAVESVLKRAGISTDVKPEKKVRKNILIGTGHDMGFLIDLDRCTGCKSCEISCKMEHELPAGPIRPIRVMEFGPEKIGEKLRYDFVPMNCFHCGNAPCIESCPTGAMQKRDDGIVFVDKETCIGCKQCIKACPFGAPQYDPASGKVDKCDLCMHRIDAELVPACVSKCPTNAILAGNIVEMEKQTVERQLNIIRPYALESTRASVRYATRFEQRSDCDGEFKND